jgi:hypothetical protein
VVGLTRVLSFLWPRSGLPAAPVGERTPEAVALMGRGRAALEIGERALHPVEPLGRGGGDGVACELFREAVVFALLAHAELASKDVREGTEGAGVAAAWTLVDPALLTAAAGGAESLAELRALVDGKSFVELATLESAEQRRVAERLRAFAEALLTPLDAPARQLERAWVQRLARVGCVVALLIGTALVIREVKAWQERQTDLAVRATWTASSLGYGACKAPTQRCVESPTFFFHTAQEAKPSIVFDLRGTKHISAIFVENRRDCCGERAVPLVVEVSTDNKRWKEVARQTRDFTTFAKRFSRVKARYVRLRVDRASILHLATVRVLP